MSPRKAVHPKSETVSTAVLAHAEAAVAAKPEPDPIVSRVIVAAPPCALEDAPIGAKCIVARTDEGKQVRLLTPSGTTVLEKEDIFYTLPSGAKVHKRADQQYAAYHLGHNPDALFVAHSARDAVTLYLQQVK